MVSRIGHAGFGKRNAAGEFAEVGGLPVLSAGLGGEAFQQVAVLFGVEILRDAIHALKGQYVAAQFLTCRAIGALGRDLGQVRAGLGRGPRGLKLAGTIGHRRHLDQRADAARAQDMRFDLGIGSGVVLLIANVGGERDGAVVEQHLRGDGSRHVAGRIRNHPAQKLLPEQIVRRVAQRRTHLPAPTASGGHDRGAAAAEILGDQQRQLPAFGRDHVGENGCARLGSAGIFVVHQVGQLLPFGGVGGGVVDQAGDDAVHAGGREFGGGVGGAVASDRPRDEKCRPAVGSMVGSRSVSARGVPAAIGERELAAEQQQAAAAAIDELVDQFLLAGSEIAGFDRADDQSLIGEKILGAGGKAVGQFFGIGDSLAVDLVFAGADDGDDLHHAVVLFGLADELVLPARLAFDIEDAARFGADIHHAGQGVVGGVLFAGERSGGDLQRLGAGAADIEHQRLGLQVAVRPRG